MAIEGEEREAEGVGSEPLLSVLLLAGLCPVGGREVEDATLGPARQEAEEIPQIGPRRQAVQSAARQQRHEGRVHRGGLVGADEEPVLAPDHLAAELKLAAVVVQGRRPSARKRDRAARWLRA